MPSVSVTINGKTYRMACDDGQEAHLIELAARFEQYVEHLKGSFGDIGDQRLTVMAGVMVTDELDELKKKVTRLEMDLKDARENQDGASRNQDSKRSEVATEIIAAAEKIEQLGKRLSGV